MKYGLLVPFHPEFQVSIYPNPFTTSFSCSFALEQSARVSLTIYDLHGREIEKILDDRLYGAGEHRIDRESPDLPAAIYIAVLRLNGQIVSSDKVIKLQ